MRELTVRIRFTENCLGNVPATNRKDGGMLLPRSPSGHVTFLASWHHANMRFAAELLGKHQDEVGKISWDINVDGAVRRDCWVKRWYRNAEGKKRYAMHETFAAGQVVGIHCVVPQPISDDDFIRLMNIAGQYRGLSPWKPGEYGSFDVVDLRPRRRFLRDADPPPGQLPGVRSTETTS